MENDLAREHALSNNLKGAISKQFIRVSELLVSVLQQREMAVDDRGASHGQAASGSGAACVAA